MTLGTATVVGPEDTTTLTSVPELTFSSAGGSWLMIWP
jgi:hypothetical protein